MVVAGRLREDGVNGVLTTAGLYTGSLVHEWGLRPGRLLHVPDTDEVLEGGEAAREAWCGLWTLPQSPPPASLGSRCGGGAEEAALVSVGVPGDCFAVRVALAGSHAGLRAQHGVRALQAVVAGAHPGGVAQVHSFRTAKMSLETVCH